jgi:hypothetical protein
MSQTRPIVVKKREEVAKESQKRAKMNSEARQLELQKIRRELLTLAQRVERIAGA